MSVVVLGGQAENFNLAGKFNRSSRSRYYHRKVVVQQYRSCSADDTSIAAYIMYQRRHQPTYMAMNLQASTSVTCS